jgi:hypothetical protein
VDISKKDETTPLSQLYHHGTIKEKLGNTNISTNQVGASKEQTKIFQRLKIVIGEGMETWVKKLIYGAMPP